MSQLSSNSCYVPKTCNQYDFDQSQGTWRINYNAVPVLIHTTNTWILFRPGDWGVWWNNNNYFWDLNPIIDLDKDRLISTWFQQTTFDIQSDGDETFLISSLNKMDTVSFDLSSVDTMDSIGNL